MNARLPLELSESLRPAINAGAILDKVTLWPWIVTVGYRLDVPMTGGGTFERFQQRTVVVQAPIADMPDATSFMPEGGEFVKADVFPATRFEDMGAEQRARYRSQYRDFLMWRKASAIGKKVEHLVPWSDYDPISVDERVERWAKPGVRFAGD